MVHHMVYAEKAKPSGALINAVSQETEHSTPKELCGLKRHVFGVRLCGVTHIEAVGGPTPTHLLEMGWRGPSPLFSGGMTSFGRGHPHVVRRVGGDLARSADASVIVVDPRCHRDLLASLLA